MSSGGVRRPVTTTEHLIATLREDIVTGRLAPGSPIRLDDVSARFGVSPIPVREALRALEAERFVVLRPHRTAVVADLPLTEVEDLYQVRILLEVEAARRAAERVTPDVLAVLQDLLARLDAARRGADGERRSLLHREFHAAVLAACGSPTLAATAGGLYRQTERVRLALRVSGATGRRPRDADHGAMLRALASGDPAAAAETTRAHLQWSVDQVREALRTT